MGKQCALACVIALLAGRAGSRAADPEPGESAPPPAPRVTPVPDPVRKELGLDPFYKKYVSAGGLAVVSSEKPSDFALLEAAYLIDQVLAHREDIRRAMIQSKAHVAVMAATEFTTDIPEHSHMRPKDYADRRARGMGGHTVSCAEENLLSYPGDPYAAENIFIHEFAHGVHSTLRALDPSFQRRLREAYDRAMQGGLWKGKYAATNDGEYWAEGVQSWFDTNRENDSSHNHVNTRAEIKEYDPPLSRLLEEVLGDRPWRYTRVPERLACPHLKGYDPARAPTFSWPDRLKNVSLREPERLELAALGIAPPPPSKEGGKETTILFVNKTGGEVALAWIDAQGKEEPRGKLAAGERREQKTFAGHVWLVSASDGKRLGVVVAAERIGRAVIGAGPGGR